MKSLNRKRAFFVSCVDFQKGAFSGGQRLALTHYQMLRSIFGEENLELLIVANGKDEGNTHYLGHTSSKVGTFLNLFKGYVRGYTPAAEKKLLNLVDKCLPDLVFVDFSCYGQTVQKIKERHPSIVILSFFHNVEADYEKNRMKDSKLYFFSEKASFKAEQLTCKYSDHLISLNQRDTTRIRQLYGAECSLELPISITPEQTNGDAFASITDYLLFVGAVFGPNVDGISWFCKTVAPSIDRPIVIVGKGFEAYKNSLESYPHVHVIGSVDNLAPYYNGALAVIMPIRYGDGMKVKTAEALMYGKTVIGTSEAFEGYEIQDGVHGYLANTAEEFVDAINNKPLWNNNENSRQLFLKNHSANVNAKKLEGLLYTAFQNGN